MSDFRNQDVQNIFTSISNAVSNAVNSFNQWQFRQSWSKQGDGQPFDPQKRPPNQQNGQPPPGGKRPPYSYGPPPYQRPPRQGKAPYNNRPPYQAPPPGARPQQPPYGAPPGGRSPYPQNNPYARRAAPPPGYRPPVNGAPGQPPRPPQKPGKHTVVPHRNIKTAQAVIAALLLAFFSFLFTLAFTVATHIMAALGVVISLLVSGCVFTGVFLGLRPKKRLPEQASAEPKQEEEEKPASTGNKDVDKLIADGNRFIKQMQEANAAIADPEISAQIERLETVSRKIFDFVAQNPEKIPQIRKFMNYYLPTTMKLLRSYDRLGSQGVKGDNISATMHEIEGMMHTIVIAFEKQLDLLFQDEAMDIATDIAVMESMMAQEGLTDDFEKQEESPKKS